MFQVNKITFAYGFLPNESYLLTNIFCLQKFIDIGHYVREITAYSCLVEKLNSMEVEPFFLIFYKSNYLISWVLIK